MTDKENITPVTLLPKKSTSMPALKDKTNINSQASLTGGLKMGPKTRIVSASKLPKRKLVDENGEWIETVKNRKLEEVKEVTEDKGVNEEEKEFEFRDTTQCCKEIVKKLNIPNKYCESETPLTLFERLEMDGLLTAPVLKFFASNMNIRSVTLTNTLAPKLNDCNLLIPSKVPLSKCTTPFYAGFSNLLMLDLSDVPIEDNDVRYLIKLKNLKVLGLSGTRISRKGLAYLSKHASFCPTLDGLLLQRTNIGDDSLESILRFASLSQLFLSHTKISHEKITLLADLPELKTLQLPTDVFSYLRDKHVVYSDPKIAMQLEKNPNSLKMVKAQLKIHQKNYENIYLNLEDSELRKKLNEVTVRRRKEEQLWNLL